MVQAILAGRKKMTRRVVKDEQTLACIETGITEGIDNLCPYGQVGDVLWVRETWCDPTPDKSGYPILYKADFPLVYNEGEVVLQAKDYKFKPSIFMPKEACRIFLRITSIHVERLRDISREDCISEGIGYQETTIQKIYRIGGDWYDYERKTFNPLPSGRISPSMSFMSLWRSINGAESWNSNPWVWVVEFERIEKP